MSSGDAATERPSLADEMCLADEFGQLARPHPCGQGLPLGRWLEEGLGSGAGRPPGGWHGGMVARPRPGAAVGLGQKTLKPVTSTTAHSRISTPTSEPPTIATRRTSRAT